MSKKYKHSSKTKVEWEGLDPIIIEDEIIIEKDTKSLKIGDGISTYSELPYINNISIESNYDDLDDNAILTKGQLKQALSIYLYVSPEQ